METGRKGSEGRTGQKQQKVDDISFPTPLRYQEIEFQQLQERKKAVEEELPARGLRSSRKGDQAGNYRPSTSRLLPLDWVRSSLAQM